MSKYKIIALFGKSGSGKNTVQEYLIDTLENSHKIINCTSRPPRDYEKNNVDYHFLSKDDFADKIMYDKSIIEYTLFNDWLYGTSLDDLNIDKINIGVFTLTAIKQLLLDDRLEVSPIYIQADDDTRLYRSISREKNPDCHEICRRFLADEEDFKEKNLSFPYISFNNNFRCDLEKAYKLLIDILNN